MMEKVYFREDLFVQNDNEKRKFDKTCVVFPLVETSLMNQAIPRGEFKFDSYEKDGGCYIKLDNFHYHVNECDLFEVKLCPCKEKRDGVEPCNEMCACAHKLSSRGCDKCATYGSYEQRIEMMKKLNG